MLNISSQLGLILVTLKFVRSHAVVTYQH